MPATVRTRTVRLVAAAALGVGLLGLAPPAHAEQVAVTDPADATASFTDIRRVTVDHGVRRVVTKVRFTDLRRRSSAGPASLAIFLDTRPARRGPEYRLGSGLQAGTDYQLVRMRDWRPVGDPLSCAHSVRLDFADDVLRFRVARPCVGSPEQVRVRVRMTDLWDGSHPVVDWLKGERRFTRWLASS